MAIDYEGLAEKPWYRVEYAFAAHEWLKANERPCHVSSADLQKLLGVDPAKADAAEWAVFTARVNRYIDWIEDCAWEGIEAYPPEDQLYYGI